MMTNKHKALTVTFSIVASLFVIASTPSFAASEKECSIWLCAPLAFGPSACKDARKALIKRIFKGKPALPLLPSCMSGGDRDSSDNNDASESEITAIEGSVLKVDGEWVAVRGCLKRDRKIGYCSRSITTYNNGVQEGETFYFNEYHDDIK